MSGETAAADQRSAQDRSAPPSWRAEAAAGFRLSLATGLGMYPIGVAFGVLVAHTGLPWWTAPALSTAAYAGSLELLLVGMLAATTPLATIALTTLLVNFRHVFYAFSFPLRTMRNPVARLYSVYALTDEAYAVTAAAPGAWTPWRLFALQAAFQCYWVGGGLTGVLAASAFPGQIKGLEFALCALFVTLALDSCRSCAQLPSILLAGSSFAIAVLFAPGSALFAALLLFVATLAVRYLVELRRSAHA